MTPSCSTLFIRKVLESLDFVLWDRYTENVHDDPMLDYPRTMVVYGWINREDQYKDFVVIEFSTKREKTWVECWITSSKKYSKKISELIDGPNGLTHNDCIRVEHSFNIPNAIKEKVKA